MRRLVPALALALVPAFVPVLVPALVPVLPVLAVPPLHGARAIEVTQTAEVTKADAPAAARASDKIRTDLRTWTGEQLAQGRIAGTELRRGRVFLAEPVGKRVLGGTSYDLGRWESGWVKPGFGFTELVSSWEAKTPGDSAIEVEVRGQDSSGRTSSWDVLGRWAYSDTYIDRTSLGSQQDDLARVAADTWRAAAAAGLERWRLRVTLLRRTGATTKAPSLGHVGATTSRRPDSTPPTSKPGVVAQAGGAVLQVPRYSQMVHDGHYPQWGGGGEAWCSPTSVSMVLAFHDALPPAEDYAWVPQGHPSPWVDHAARMTFDHGYDGTGNWSFNVAYAARLVGRADVVRLPDLRAVERLVADRIPVVVSIAFDAGELSGAPISSSDGHLLVVVGFTAEGDVVVNDPAADSPAGVRRTYDRAQLERAWLSASTGTAYVLRR